MPSMLQNHQSLGLGDKETRESWESPDPDDLEELARTADAEVAHRAFLVPAHKKRGKGGRQPATDPRLDPNVDERKAKRILANRLSAARSKMKQKNQMEGMGKMVSQLEKFKKACQNDSAELMEECERMEKEKRRLERQIQLLEEYYKRGMHHASQSRDHGPVTEPFPIDDMSMGHGRMMLFD